MPSSAEPFLKYRTLCDEEKNCYHAKKGIVQDVKIASSLAVDDNKSFQNKENEPDSKQDYTESSSDEDCGNEETACQNSNQEESVNLCTDNLDSTEVQDISHESAFAKRLKTKHNSDTEQDIKHSDDAGCCLCDNDNALLKEGQLMRQNDDTDVSESKCLRLHNFLEQESLEYFDKYKVPDKDLRRFIVMDVVIPCLRKTICFTKR